MPSTVDHGNGHERRDDHLGFRPHGAGDTLVQLVANQPACGCRPLRPASNLDVDLSRHGHTTGVGTGSRPEKQCLTCAAARRSRA